MFVICVIATHSWSIINLFRDVASWSLSLSVWDLLGSVSYTLISILFEALVVFLILLLLIGVLLPKKWLGNRSITISTVIILESTILAIVFKPYIAIGFSMGTFQLLSLLVIALLLIAILLIRNKRIESIINRIVEPLTTLAFVYVFIDLIGLIIVLIRNL